MSALLTIAVVSAALLFAGVFIWGSLERAGEGNLPKPRRRSF
jgi:hypothetical protein